MSLARLWAPKDWTPGGSRGPRSELEADRAQKRPRRARRGADEDGALEVFLIERVFDVELGGELGSPDGPLITCQEIHAHIAGKLEGPGVVSRPCVRGEGPSPETEPAEGPFLAGVDGPQAPAPLRYGCQGIAQGIALIAEVAPRDLGVRVGERRYEIEGRGGRTAHIQLDAAATRRADLDREIAIYRIGCQDILLGEVIEGQGRREAAVQKIGLEAGLILGRGLGPEGLAGTRAPELRKGAEGFGVTTVKAEP